MQRRSPLPLFWLMVRAFATVTVRAEFVLTNYSAAHPLKVLALGAVGFLRRKIALCRTVSSTISNVTVSALVILLISTAEAKASPLQFDTVTLTDRQPTIKIELAWRPGVVAKHPAILMLGTAQSNSLPSWSSNLLNEGYMLAAFSAERAPDPDPARRPQWLYFDQRFAHSYVEGGLNAVEDSGRVIDYLLKRGDVGKIGWVGSSSTGIPGLAVATQEPRLAAVVAFVSTGAYRQWLDSWHSNQLWRGQTNGLWAETESLLPKVDPILHVQKMFPCAVLMVSGADDKVVDPKTARAFVDAARPYYKQDPDRLRLVIYEGFGHNLPADIVQMYIEHWCHLYLNPTNATPLPQGAATNLQESAARTSITGSDHRSIMRAK
ncbi:MAG: alpha/beta hydrolase family protein [Limisphaerales bacterium]